MQGDPFVFGLAFWPGGTVNNWCVAARAAAAANRCPPLNGRCWLCAALHRARLAFCRRGAQYNSTDGAPGLNPCLDLPVLDPLTGAQTDTYQSYLVGAAWQRARGARQSTPLPL